MIHYIARNWTGSIQCSLSSLYGNALVCGQCFSGNTKTKVNTRSHKATPVIYIQLPISQQWTVTKLLVSIQISWLINQRLGQIPNVLPRKPLKTTTVDCHAKKSSDTRNCRIHTFRSRRVASQAHNGEGRRSCHLPTLTWQSWSRRWWSPAPVEMEEELVLLLWSVYWMLQRQCHSQLAHESCNQQIQCLQKSLSFVPTAVSNSINPVENRGNYSAT